MLTSALSSLTEFIAAHPELAYLAVFLLALSEALPVIGLLFPGTAAILAVSALIPTGAVTLWPVLLSVIAGAIVGDGLSFWLGHRYHQKILGMWPLDRNPGLIRQGEAFFARHGDKSVFLARFIPGVRAIVPLFAGIVGMSVFRFYVANILSAVVWATSHVLSAVFVGASISRLGSAAKPIAILIALVIVSFWVAWHILTFALRKAGPILEAALAGLRSWSSARDTRLSRTVSGVLARPRAEAILMAASGVVIIAAAWVFLGILQDVVSGDPLVQVDQAIFQGLQALRTSVTDSVMITITELGDTVVVIPVVIAVLLLLAWKRAWRTATFWLATIAGASAINSIVKATLRRVRPEDTGYSGWSEYSFPSGHSTTNIVLYGFLAILIARELRPAWHIPLAFVTLVFTLFIAFSRIYLGAHWFSDVAGGLSFGTVWLTLAGFFLLHGRKETIGPASLAGVAFVTLMTTSAINIDRNHKSDVERYAINEVTPVIVAKDWRDHAWRDLPARRVDLTGETEEPFTLQWAGSLAALESRLIADGWTHPPSLYPAGLLAWLSTNTDSWVFPAFPLLASGRPASLVLVKRNDAQRNTRLVLRLWAADRLIADSDVRPLWVGTVISETMTSHLHLFTLATGAADANAPRDAVAKALTAAAAVERERPAADWDGRVLLAGE